MLPVLRGVTVPAISSGSVSTPAATQIGDLCVFFVWSQGTVIPSHAIQAGFTEIRTHSHDDGTTDGRLSVAYRVATANGVNAHTPYTITNATANQTSIGVMVFEVGTFDVTALPTSNSSTLTTNAVPNPPSVTGLTGDFYVLAIGAWHVTTAGATACAPGANYTERMENASASHVTHLNVSSRSLTALNNATEDPPAFTDNVAPNGSVSMTIAIKGATTGSASITLGALTTTATAKAEVQGSASITFGALTTTAPTPSIGAHEITVQLFGAGSNPARVTINPTTNGASWVVSRGGKTSDISGNPVTDNKGNTYTLIGSVVDMTDWAGYGSGVYHKLNGIGGASHNFDSFVTNFDEHTVTVVECIGVNQVEDHSFVQRANAGSGPTFAATPVTVTGPAIIIAEWWGTHPVGSGDHIVTASDGFTELESYFVDDPNGYVQHYTFGKVVSAAGTYGVTFTATPNQGAQLRMIALSSTIQGSTGTVTGGSGAAGTANVTLGALTATATGKTEIAGSLSKTFGTLTATATGKTEIAGAFSKALGALTSTATGTVVTPGGSASVTFGALTVSATGKTEIAGALSKTFGALTTTATGKTEVAGQASRTFGAPTVTATGKVDIVGQASNALGALTTTATGKTEIVGAFNKTFGALTITALGTGLVTTEGLASITLGSLTASATGKAEIAGTLSKTFGALTVSASGQVETRGSASITLGSLAGTGAGIAPIHASFNRTFSALTITATGIVDPIATDFNFGQANITFKPLTATIRIETDWQSHFLSRNKVNAVVIKIDGSVTKVS